jgi:hypothetical protein
MAEKPVTSALPIVPYPSVVQALDHFEEAGGAPSEMHGSVFPKNKFSGTTISLLVRAFKQLGLADEQGNTLHEKIDPLISPETRKAAMQALLQRTYGTLIEFVGNSSPNQFNKWFDEYHMNGEDTRKARTFFLQAARANDIPVSAFVTNKYKTRARGPVKTIASRGSARTPNVSKTSGAKKRNAYPGEQGEVRSVDLGPSDARITLTVSKGIMQLTRGDREFVLGLINEIEDYEKGGPE